MNPNNSFYYNPNYSPDYSKIDPICLPFHDYLDLYKAGTYLIIKEFSFLYFLK